MIKIPHMNRGSIYTPSFKTNHYVPLWGDCTLWSRWLDALVSSPVTEPFKLWPDTNQRPVSTDQTCPVMKTALWNLIGVDRTLAPSVRSLTSQRPIATRWLYLDQMNWPDSAPASGHTETSVQSTFDPPFTSNLQSYVNEVCSNWSKGFRSYLVLDLTSVHHT